MKKHKTKIVLILFVAVFLIGSPVLAQTSAGVQGLTLPTTDIRMIVINVVRVALAFLGLVAVILILYGGYVWMTSAGNEEQIGKAKKVLINAGIGLAIILAALGIVQFIISTLQNSLMNPPLPPPRPATGRVGGGALGSGIIESHYPMRGAVDVPRNTRVVVTFKEKMDPSSIAEIIPGALAEDTAVFSQSENGSYHYPVFYYDHDNDSATPVLPISALRLKRSESGIPDVIQIIKTEDIEDSVKESDGTKYLGSDSSNVDILVSFTEDLRTFIFTPVDRDDRSKRALFGSSEKPIPYTIYICGIDSSGDNCAVGGVKLLSTGRSAFQGMYKDYQWSFDVGTFIDETPPKISTVIPTPESENPPNVMVQVNYSEAILPIVASGKTMISGATTTGSQIQPGSFSIMRVKAVDQFVGGEWFIGNQYQTSEFVSNDLCGRNSCGQDVFCLPRSQNIDVEVLAASLAQPGNPASSGLFDGIEDIAGNSLDGNKNGVAVGPNSFFNLNTPDSTAGDNVTFRFATGANVLLGAPAIENTNPLTTLDSITPGASLNNFVETVYDRFMAMSSLNSINMILSGIENATGGKWDTWWTVSAINFEINDEHQYGSAKSTISHGGLWEETNYLMENSSGVKDLYQNCFYPSSGSGIVVPGNPPGNTSCDADSNNPNCCNGLACQAGDSICRICGL